MKITDTVHQLNIPFVINLSSDKKIERYVNIFIIMGRYVYLIDSGVKGTEQLIFKYLKKNGRNPDEIKSVFLTHVHPDHIGALKAIKKNNRLSGFYSQ